jgi:hypothetical protein
VYRARAYIKDDVKTAQLITMYHLFNLLYVKRAAADAPAHFIGLLLIGVLALLICNSAAGLASRLARGLALAATAVLCALAKVLSIKGLNTLHIFYPPL